MTKAVHDVQAAIVASHTAAQQAYDDLVLTESLGALHAVADVADGKSGVGSSMAGVMAMISVLCKHYVPGVISADFDATQLFSAMATDVSFEVLATQILEQVTLTLQEASVASESRPAEPSPIVDVVPRRPLAVSGSVTTAAFAEAPTPTGAFGDNDVLVTARLAKQVADLLGIKTGWVMPLVSVAVAVQDGWRAYQATRSVRTALSSFDNVKVWANVLILFMQVVIEPSLTSNEPAWLDFVMQPIWVFMDRFFEWEPAWSYARPSATEVLRVIRQYKLRWATTSMPSTQQIMRLYREGLGLETLLWMAFDDIPGNRTNADRILAKWIDHIKSNTNFPYYTALKRSSTALVLASMAFNYAATAATAANLWQRANMGNRTYGEETMKYKELLDELAEQMPAYADMSFATEEDQSNITLYSERIMFASNSESGSKSDMLALMKELYELRKASRDYNWSVVDAGVKRRLEVAMRRFNRIANLAGIQRIDAQFADSRASVVDALFKAHL